MKLPNLMHEFAYAKRYYCLMKYVNLPSAKKNNIKKHEHIGDAPRLLFHHCSKLWIN